MNSISTFLSNNWQRLQLDDFGTPNLSVVFATPRFRASSHVVCMVFTDRRREPILIVKVPRLVGDIDRLNCEARNLQRVQGARHGGFDSIPRLICFESYLRQHLLVETALPGQSLSCHLQTRNAGKCFESTMEWLIELHQATAHRGDDVCGWYERLVREPLVRFSESLRSCDDMLRAVERTLDETFGLRFQRVPLVAEHGDLGPPNILVRGNGRIGVVDWELAKPRGLPLVDLIFLLTLVAFAQHRTRRGTDYQAAFQGAFFGDSAWARPYLTRYVRELDLDPEIVTPMFILTWGRYVAQLASRLHDASGSEPIEHDTLKWLRNNRYFSLWCYTIDHAKQLNLVD